MKERIFNRELFSNLLGNIDATYGTGFTYFDEENWKDVTSLIGEGFKVYGNIKYKREDNTDVRVMLMVPRQHILLLYCSETNSWGGYVISAEVFEEAF